MELVSFSEMMSENPDTNGLKRTLKSVYGQLQSLVTSTLVLLFLIAWVSFWATVARIHYFEQDWISMLVTTALGVIPVVGILIWSTPVDRLGASLEKTIDALTPSSTARTSSE